MKAQPKDITELDIASLLAAALGGTISEGSGSKAKIAARETKHGIVTSPVARRLFTVNEQMADHILRMLETHGRSHEDVLDMTDHNCEAFIAKIQRLCARREVLHRLLWQAITEEHPAVAVNKACIRQGWHLVGEDGKWNDMVLVFDRSNIASNYIARLTSIVCDDKVVGDEDDLEPVAIGEEVIGSLTDGRIQSIRSLKCEVVDGFSKQLNAEMLGRDRETIGDLTFNEVFRLQVLSRYFENLVDITSSLFWCGVQDTIPAAADHESIGIRRAWDVVKCV